MPQKRFCACVGREADAMTSDISARRGALPIKNQRRLTSVKWLMALNYSRGRDKVTNAKRRRPNPLDNPSQFARLGNRSLKCFYRQRLVVSLGALA